jgi:uncharacterized protein
MKNYVIGALHFSPMIGYKGFENYDKILEKAKIDLKAFEEGGIGALILENNYNFPHQTTDETKEAVEMMTYLVKDLMKDSELSFGISVLFNDYKSALKIAHETGGDFVRVPAFVDDIRTSYGEIYSDSKDVIETRKNLGAEDVKIYADIQVKHAEMIDKEKTIEESALEAIAQGADGLIVTGRITGDPPKLYELKETNSLTNIPIIIGSGATAENIKSLFCYSNGVIVSTSLKKGDAIEGEVNIKPYHQEIDSQKVREFMEVVKNAV